MNWLRLLVLSVATLLLGGCGGVDVMRGVIATPDGANLHYEECGKGEAIILLHGHSLDMRMWEEQFVTFAEAGYRVVRFDFRGYGKSSEQSETEQFTHVGDLICVMDWLGIDKAHIVGLSMGGFVGADMLGLYPERMLSAILVSGNIRKSPGPSSPMTEQKAAQRDDQIAELKRRGIDTFKREWFEGLMRSGGSQRERMRESLWQMIDEWSAWQPLHKEVRVIAGLDAWAEIQQHNPEVPTLLVEGRSEHNRFSESPQILRHLPRGRQIVIDDCGHMLSMERPAEFNRIALDFIRTIGEE